MPYVVAILSLIAMPNYSPRNYSLPIYRSRLLHSTLELSHQMIRSLYNDGNSIRSLYDIRVMQYRCFDDTVKLLNFEQWENFERNSSKLVLSSGSKLPETNFRKQKSGSKLVLSSISLSIKFSRPHFLGGLYEPSRFELVSFFC